MAIAFVTVLVLSFQSALASFTQGAVNVPEHIAYESVPLDNIVFSSPQIWDSSYVADDKAVSAFLKDPAMLIVVRQLENNFANVSVIEWIGQFKSNSGFLLMTAWRYQPANSHPASLELFISRLVERDNLKSDLQLLSDRRAVSGEMNIRRVVYRVATNGHFFLNEFVSVDTGTVGHLLVVVGDESTMTAQTKVIEAVVNSLTSRQK
jgi:hypothetical protein